MAYDGGDKHTIRDTLAAYGLHPNRQLGQNFLRDQQALDAIVCTAGELTNRSVLEIGPGLGALTLRLLERAGHLTAVEIDSGFCRVLGDAWGDRENFTLIHEDAMKMDFSVFAPPPRVVVGNLPYYITTPLILRCIRELPSADILILMMQKEVAQRLTADRGKDYGSLSIAVRYHMEVERVLILPPSSFTPMPKVDSTVVRFVRRPYSLPCTDVTVLERISRAAFSMRRKTIYNNLISRFEKSLVSSLLERAGVNPMLRAETIPMEDYIRMANHLVLLEQTEPGEVIS